MKEYEAWAIGHDAAKAALVNRSSQIDDSAEQIEKDLVLLGATAIEDKLQDVSVLCHIASAPVVSTPQHSWLYKLSCIRV